MRAIVIAATPHVSMKRVAAPLDHRKLADGSWQAPKQRKRRKDRADGRRTRKERGA